MHEGERTVGGADRGPGLAAVAEILGALGEQSESSAGDDVRRSVDAAENARDRHGIEAHVDPTNVGARTHNDGRGGADQRRGRVERLPVRQPPAIR